MARNSLLTEVTALPHAARFKSLHNAGLEALTKPKTAASLIHGNAVTGRNGFIVCNLVRVVAMRHDCGG